MAVDNSKVLVGAATVEIGDWVTAGATQTTMVDVGHTKGPVTINAAIESFDVTSERAFAAIKSVMTGIRAIIKVPAMEIRPDLIAMAFGQPSSNISGTAPNQTTLIGTPAEQYKQVKITGPGPGTNATRVATFWRCTVKLAGDLPIAKGDSQVLELEINALYDSSVSTGDKIGKIVDT